MRNRPAHPAGRRFRLLIACLIAVCASSKLWQGATAGEARRTAIVDAVERASSAIVNIHGEKTVDAGAEARPGEAKRRVNGMGTGVLVDERGYIITNHHVVDGVKKIMVTTSGRESFIAKLVSHDPKTDLAVIKIDADHKFETIPIGTSSDLMPGETVIAVGNAFGYEHTVTRGIISALHRTVQVSDTQNYEDLIQTDAPINPGNSGGPLLNIEGDLIGINVAVRAGAQGIGFAIPADKVFTIATDLMSTRRLAKAWHGVEVVHKPGAAPASVVVSEVEQESPAATSGLLPGDVIKTVGDREIARPLDIERALIGQQAGQAVDVTVERNQRPVKVPLMLAALPASQGEEDEPSWELLGVRLEPMPAKQFQQFRSRYRGGLAVTDVRPDGPAARQGIRRGDVLVGMHVWETVSMDNVAYILSRPDFAQLDPLKFYILRGSETLYGHLTVSSPRSRR